METQIENLYSRIQNLADSHRNGKPVTEKLKGLFVMDIFYHRC